jgi:imidazolonepropionase-like amidohydrolase
MAGTARAFGLSEEAAIKALTKYPAMIFGIDSTYGTLEVGKSATLFVSEGDALDAKSNRLLHAFIDGREVDLSTRHTRLAKKYRERLQRK